MKTIWKQFFVFNTLAVCSSLSGLFAAGSAESQSPYPRPLRELYTSEFPMQWNGAESAESVVARAKEVRERILLAAGLLPLPTKHPLNAVVHGRIDRGDYTIDKVFFESFPGFYVTGNLYLPKTIPNGSGMPGILCPHGHWPKGRFMDLGVGTPEANKLIATGAERFETAARNPMQARCVQLARMGCAAFLYDTLGNADSVQISDHRSGKRENLDGVETGTYGLFSAMADLRLQSSFGVQTWNSIRALDFLLTVPGVDASRIAVTGASGGGTQTMVLSAIDERVKAAFPCVMVSTAMQGGCTCENACYLRIGQGNIDIAAASAPKPFGVTTADDWTKELQAKGWPDLQRVWTLLGKGTSIEAHFNNHFPHNYNHVSRVQMYGFINKHFALGLSTPVLERDYTFTPESESTVWSVEHPKPAGQQAEASMLKHWAEDSDLFVTEHAEMVRKGWSVILGRSMPAATALSFIYEAPVERPGYTITHGKVCWNSYNEDVSVTLYVPTQGLNGKTILWLTSRENQEAEEDVKRLLREGFTVCIPRLYLSGANSNPWNPLHGPKDRQEPFTKAACYTYGYNHPLVVHRVHDVMSVAAMLRGNQAAEGALLLVSADKQTAPVGCIAGAIMETFFDGALIDTGGFRFASVRDQQDRDFVPGAVKYGDVPALLKLCNPDKTKVLGEGGLKNGEAPVSTAVIEWSAKLKR
jgi:Acetyl xylan esterase (AXE1)